MVQFAVLNASEIMENDKFRRFAPEVNCIEQYELIRKYDCCYFTLLTIQIDRPLNSQFRFYKNDAVLSDSKIRECCFSVQGIENLLGEMSGELVQHV